MLEFSYNKTKFCYKKSVTKIIFSLEWFLEALLLTSPERKCLLLLTKFFEIVVFLDMLELYNSLLFFNNSHYKYTCFEEITILFEHVETWKQGISLSNCITNNFTSHIYYLGFCCILRFNSGLDSLLRLIFGEKIK